MAVVLAIGSLRVDPPLVLAPMAGVTDRYFRTIVRRLGGVGLVTMEFVPSKGLVAGRPEVEQRMEFGDEERPISIQVYGSDAATMAEAARRVEEAGADVCDVNMGCPANKVLKGCAGAALMGDLTLAREIVAAVRRALTIPLTVKFRLGLDERRRTALELGRICQGEGVDAVAVHARTARQMFTGEADWEEIARLKEALAIPVLGNGDVREPADALRLLEVSGCDGVLIGRGATRNPWIFRQTAELLAGRRAAAVGLEDRRRLIVDHFRSVVAGEEPRWALHKLRLFTKWYSQGLPRGERLRRRIQELADSEGFFAALDEFFADAALERAA